MASMDVVPQPEINGKPFILAIFGSSGSGKTTLRNFICDYIKNRNSTYTAISIDNFYKDNLTNNSNFDSPSSIDWELFNNTLYSLLNKQEKYIYEYDFKTHSRSNNIITIPASKFIIVEGLLAVYSPILQTHAKFMININTDADVCLARRIQRDIRERGRTVESVIHQWISQVKPGYLELRPYIDDLDKNKVFHIQNNSDIAHMFASKEIVSIISHIDNKLKKEIASSAVNLDKEAETEAES